MVTSRGSLGSTGNTSRRSLLIPPPENQLLHVRPETTTHNSEDRNIADPAVDPTVALVDDPAVVPSTSAAAVEGDAIPSCTTKTLINVGMFVTDKKTKKDIKRAVSSLFLGEWVSYGCVPKEVRSRMYETFMAPYVLPPDEVLYVQPLFNKIACKWLREAFTIA